MRNSMIFQYAGCAFLGVTRKTRNIEICAQGLYEWFGVDTHSPKYQRFRVTIRKQKFPHSFRIYTKYSGRYLSKNKDYGSVHIYPSLTYWLESKYPDITRNSITKLYVRIEWLKGKTK